MYLKSHPEYWNTHKKIWQEEYDNLTQQERDEVMSDPQNKKSRMLNSKVDKLISRMLLSSVE